MANETKIVISAVDDTHRAIASVKRDLGELSDVVGGMPGIAAFGAASAAGLALIVISAVDAQYALADLGKSTNLAVDLLAGLGFAAKTSGSDLDSVAKSINKLQVNIANAPEKYRALGITATDGYQALLQLADIFVAIEEPEQLAAVAAEALGKSWAGAAPLLSAGSDEIAAMVEKGSALSGVTTDSAEAAAELNGKLDELKAAATGLGVRLANNLVHLLTEIAAGMVDSSDKPTQAEGSFSVITETLRAMVVFGANVAYVFRSIGIEIGGMAAQAAALANLNFTAASGIGEAMREDAQRNRQEFDAYEKRLMTAGQTFADYSNEGRGRGILPTKPTAPSAAAVGGFLGLTPKKSGGGGGKGRSAGSKSAGTFKDYDATLIERITRAIEHTDIIKAAELASTLAKLDELAAAGLDPAIVKAVRDDLTGAAKTAADEVKRLNDFLADTPTAQIEKARDDMVFLAKALEDGKIKEEQYLEAVIARLGIQGEAVQKTLVDLDQFAVQAASNIQDAFADFLFDPFKDGTDGMLKSFGDAVRRMIANAVAADLGRRLFGDIGSNNGSLGGWVGKGLGIVSGLLGFGEVGPQGYAVPGSGAGAPVYGGDLIGGSFASGIDYVPHDMIAQIHKGERVVPAAENRSGGRPINITVNVSGASGNAAEVRRAAGQGAREALSAMAGARRYV